MTTVVNDSVREGVILALHRRKMTRRELAKQAGLNYSYLSRILSGNVEGGREAWQAIFEVLGLELTVKEKGE